MTTIKDISKVAGVSITTVSRALNGYSDVNENTRNKVLKVAKELNYVPNTIARSLVMNKSKTIGLLVSGFTKGSIKDNFMVEVMAGINEYAADSDYDLVLFSTNSTKQREKSYSQLCKERRVDGAIIQGIKIDDPYLQEVVSSEIPCVLIDIPIENDTVAFVTTDNALGAKKAVQHLIDLGHTNIALVNGHEKAFVSKRRLDGYVEALKSANLHLHEDWIVDGKFDEATAELVAEKLLRLNPEITAIFCASDLMGLGALKAANKLGKRIPEDLSIVGYDDIILAAYASPPLTTIAQNKFKMGYEAAKLLIHMLEGSYKPENVTLETELIIRNSTIKNRP
jgi:LacI family transcriptional regulator